MWRKALALFDEMEEKGIEPTEVTYRYEYPRTGRRNSHLKPHSGVLTFSCPFSVTISALGNGLQWERALSLLNLVSADLACVVRVGLGRIDPLYHTNSPSLLLC